ncbi:MAG: HAMP domain-containing histidine kinase [Tannerellaceae bacterium]|jgi:signal transduction histidine kinase|nr:HAMP domain-containing histidine kinase [Tannerellaceae bacterium]
MKVQTRLSLLGSVIFGIIFTVISFLIYGLFYRNVTRSIYDNLQKTALITAVFFLEEDELNKEEFSKARKRFYEFVSNSYYQIYNEADSVNYGSPLPLIPADLLQTIRDKRQLAFSYEGFLCYGIFYEDNQGNFVVVSKEKKDVSAHQLNLLLWILVIAFLLGMSSIILLSRWMANAAYRPFRTVIRQVTTISTHNLDKQIEIPNTKDELQDLIITFNNLLSQLSETFIIQKNFVNYVSHEFKTPLTSILGNLEVFSLKDRTPEEYTRLSQALIQQIKQLEETLETLLIISDLRNRSDISDLIRIDEVIWEIISNISHQYRKSNLSVNMEIPPTDEYLLNVSIEKTQLVMTLYNLIENAVKYSHGEQVDIRIYKTEERLTLSITDKGIGIPSEQLTNISKPFFRADNTNQIQGSGIGLSIALRILEKNHIKYNIHSVVNEGTTITLLF